MKWAVHVEKVDYLAKMAKLMSDNGAELLDVSYEYDIVTARANVKKMRKIFKKADRNGIEFELLDYKTYMYVRDRKPNYLSNCVAIFRGDGHNTINPLKIENGRKEKADGKTLSSPVGMVGKARDPEEDRVPVGEEREAGSADVDVPVADTGRPAGTGEDTGYSQVAVPGSEVDTMEIVEMVPPIDTSECYLSFDDYAKRYSIPVRTLRKWVSDGTVKSTKDEKGRLHIQEGPKYPFKPSAEGIPATNLRWKWLDKNEFESMKLAERPSDGV